MITTAGPNSYTTQLTRKAAYAKKYGLRSLPYAGCWHRVFNKRPQIHDSDCRGPHADHSNVFKDIATGAIVWTEQPYALGAHPSCVGFVNRLTAEVQQFASTHGLTVRISAEDSWHFPGATVLVEYRKDYDDDHRC